MNADAVFLIIAIITVLKVKHIPRSLATIGGKTSEKRADNVHSCD